MVTNRREVGCKMLCVLWDASGFSELSTRGDPSMPDKRKALHTTPHGSKRFRGLIWTRVMIQSEHEIMQNDVPVRDKVYCRKHDGIQSSDLSERFTYLPIRFQSETTLPWHSQSTAESHDIIHMWCLDKVNS